MSSTSDDTTIGAGRHLALVDRGGWEYATRVPAREIVAVVAVTERGELVLVEQHRPPVSGPVIEIPAGIVGDDAGRAGESLADAARRELLEETGFRADSLVARGRFVSSAGLTDEVVTFFVAEGVSRVADGGGVGSERIRVHTVALAGVMLWVEAALNRGISVDARVLSALTLVGRVD
ncbi:MAG: NUDIX hydrolase [Planctomycetota bacterium]